MKKLITFYDNVRIKAALKERVEGKTGIFDLEYLQNKKSIKILITYVSGDRLHFSDDVSVRVVNPEKSFILVKPPGTRNISVSFLGGANDDDRTQVTELLECSLLRTHYFLLGMPIAELLAQKGALIKNVTEEEDSGKTLTRIHVRFDPHPKLKEWYDRCDGQFLFDPTSLWALRGFDIKYMKKNEDQLGFRVVETIDYDESRKDVPTLSGLQQKVFDEQGQLLHDYRVKVNSIEFGQVSPEEFTLRGCGLGEDFEGKPSRFRTMIFWYLGNVVVLALLLIFILRHRKAKSKAAG